VALLKSGSKSGSNPVDDSERNHELAGRSVGAEGLEPPTFAL
jgi:hypothetical protein